MDQPGSNTMYSYDTWTYPYKKTTSPFPNQCGTLTHSNAIFDRYSSDYNNVYLSMLLCIQVFQVEGKMSSVYQTSSVTKKRKGQKCIVR